MFIIFNKQKIYSYLISISMVIMLFMLSAFIVENQKTAQTSASATKLLPVYNVKTEKADVALTINCAWNADDIDLILQVLEKYNYKVTFFMVGDWIDKYEEATKKIYNKGHEIANHSNTHPKVASLSYEQNIEEIQKCAEKIEKITGTKSMLYRAPYGEYNNTVISAANSQNHLTIQWNIDTLDYTGLTGEEMWGRIDKKLENGSIILTHNGTKNTANSLEFIIGKIKEKGYNIVKVSELIYKENYNINSHGTQIYNNNSNL